MGICKQFPENSRQCHWHTIPSKHLLFNAYDLTVLSGIPFLLSTCTDLSYVYQLTTPQWYYRKITLISKGTHLQAFASCLGVYLELSWPRWYSAEFALISVCSWHLSYSLGQWFPRVNPSQGRRYPRGPNQPSKRILTFFYVMSSNMLAQESHTAKLKVQGMEVHPAHH